MNSTTLVDRVRASLSSPPPLPGVGRTPERLRYLLELGREDLSLARLAEAHWDAVAILVEAGRQPEPGALYAVWAAEIPGKSLELKTVSGRRTLSGAKPFCSGAGLVDRALITVAAPEARLLDINLRSSADLIRFDHSFWHSTAFSETKTATTTFSAFAISESDVVGPMNFYLSRPGFWNGACGPAACWVGGALGLLDWGLLQKRDDPHTRAHLGAMTASGWALESLLESAGREIDSDSANVLAAQVRALSLRHLVEQHCTEILRRFARAFGPHPLAFEASVSRRYLELDLYLRQSHAERDLEALLLAKRRTLPQSAR